jgi:hypothetical protein
MRKQSLDHKCERNAGAMNKAKEAHAELLTTQLRNAYLSAAGDRVWEKPLLVKNEGDILMHTKLYHRKATDHYFPQVLGCKFVIVLREFFPSSLFPGVNSSKPNMKSQGASSAHLCSRAA